MNGGIPMGFQREKSRADKYDTFFEKQAADLPLQLQKLESENQSFAQAMLALPVLSQA